MAGASSSSVAAAAAAASRLKLAEKACEYLAVSTDPFHAVANAVAKLRSAGFQKLPNASFAAAAKLQPGGKYYYTVHHSTLVAFAVGPKYGSGGTPGGFHIIGGHTDSPNLRVKPKSKKPPKHGCIQLGVECYGGGLWHTWFDRDLGISGKVLVRNADDPNKLSHRLVQLKDPVARVSTLCIHLQTAEERKAFAVNKEEHTSPVVSSSCAVVDEDRVQLEKGAADQIGGGGDADDDTTTDAWREGHEPLLLQRMAETLQCRVDQIADFELSFFDTQGPVIGGIHKEFVYSGRLDNLATVFCAVESLVEHSTNDNNADDRDVAMVVCFDHEEVGSVSSHGAGSVVMGEAVRRISAALSDNNNCSPDLYADAISKSFVLSIDMAHAIHPNYASKHESQHAPQLNKGVVIKTNSNQRYATNSTTGFLVREIARKVQTPIQEVCVRNDCPCGSTIGPTISARTGMRVIDAGMPQLSMHSCREVMGVDDLTHGLELFNGFFKHFRSIDDSIQEEKERRCTCTSQSTACRSNLLCRCILFF